MHTESLRSWLEYLRAQGAMVEVTRPVDLRYELAAVVKRLDGQKAVLFSHLAGHGGRVASGIVGSRELIAQALGVRPAELSRRFAKALERPIPTRPVPRDQAPAKEVAVGGAIDLTALCPVPTHHRHDAGPYITAGLFIVRDPDTGKQNVAIHRLQVIGPNRLGVLLLPRHTRQLYRRFEQRGEPLPCAIVIGVDPLTLLASQATAAYGVDELEVAGALRGEPLPVVRCDTVDIEVPATAEFVLEGRVLPRTRAPEGPFGEFPRYYGAQGEREVVEVMAATHRRDPIFHTILPAGREHLLLGAIPREAAIFDAVFRVVPGVQAVHLTPGGSCRFHCVVSIRKEEEGQGKLAALAALSTHYDVKHVVVVDEDIDAFDLESVEWALATRFQADQDLVLVSGSQASRLDPTSARGVGAKLGFDCTIPLDADRFRFTPIDIPGYDALDLADYGLDR